MPLCKVETKAIPYTHGEHVAVVDRVTEIPFSEESKPRWRKVKFRDTELKFRPIYDANSLEIDTDSISGLCLISIGGLSLDEARSKAREVGGNKIRVNIGADKWPIHIIDENQAWMLIDIFDEPPALGSTLNRF